MLLNFHNLYDHESKSIIVSEYYISFRIAKYNSWGIYLNQCSQGWEIHCHIITSGIPFSHHMHIFQGV